MKKREREEERGRGGGEKEDRRVRENHNTVTPLFSRSFIFTSSRAAQNNAKILSRELVKLNIVCYEYYLCSPKLMDVKFWWVSKSLK